MAEGPDYSLGFDSDPLSFVENHYCSFVDYGSTHFYKIEAYDRVVDNWSTKIPMCDFPTLFDVKDRVVDFLLTMSFGPLNFEIVLILSLGTLVK